MGYRRKRLCIPQRVAVGAIATIASAAVWPAQAGSPKLALHEGSFHETVNQDVVVSGAVIVGVSDAGPIDGKALGDLAIVSRPGLSRDVCLTVLTRDGVYMASNRYMLPPDVAPGDVVVLPYQKSRHMAFLSQYADMEIAVRAISGACDATGGKTEMYAVHRSDTSGQSQLRLYINSFNATDVYASLPGQAPVDCDPVEGRRTSFDYTCNLTWPPDATPSSVGTTFQVTIEREIYGRELPKASASIVAGAVP